MSINPTTGRTFYPGPDARSPETCTHEYGYIDTDGATVCGECGHLIDRTSSDSLRPRNHAELEAMYSSDVRYVFAERASDLDMSMALANDAASILITKLTPDGTQAVLRAHLTMLVKEFAVVRAMLEAIENTEPGDLV